jgi:hypothetical protein
MSNAIRTLAIFAMCCAGVVAVAPVTATGTPVGVGLSICPPPVPDAEGNPGRYVAGPDA